MPVSWLEGWRLKRGIRRLSVCLMLVVVAACDAPGPASTKEIAVQGILSAAISEDGTLGVIGSIHHGGNAWDLARGERLYDWNHKSGERTTLRAVALSGDGRRAVTVEDRNLAVWDTQTGASLKFWQAGAKILSIALDQKGDFAAIGQQNNQAVLFDVNRGAEKRVFAHTAEVYAVAIDARAERVMTGSDDFSAVVWNAQTGEPLHRYDWGNQVKTVGLSRDGTLAFAAAQREKGRIYDLQSGDVKSVIPLEYENFTLARFTPDAQQILLGTFRGDVYRFATADARAMGHWKAASPQPFGPASSDAVLDIAQRGGELVSIISNGLLQTFTLQ